MERKTIVKEYKDYKNERGQVTANSTKELYAQGDRVCFECWTIANVGP